MLARHALGIVFPCLGLPSAMGCTPQQLAPPNATALLGDHLLLSSDSNLRSLTRSVVKIFFLDPDSKEWDGSCTGSFFGQRTDLIVTAAHCFDDLSTAKPPLVVVAFRPRSAATYFPAERYLVHPEYRSSDNANGTPFDVAVLKLTQRVGSGPDGALPLPLAERMPQPDDTLLGLGYGDQLRAPNLYLKGLLGTPSKRDHDTALQKWSASHLNELALKSTALRLARTQQRPDVLETFAVKGSLCSGDSGGPVLMNGEIVGLLSAGSDCADNDHAQLQNHGFALPGSGDFHFNVPYGRGALGRLISAIDRSGIPLAKGDVSPKP